MALQTGQNFGPADQRSRNYPISYTSGQLLNIRRNKSTTNLNITTCQKIKELGFKKTFRGTRGGKKKSRNLDVNKGVHEEWLKSLPKHNITYRIGNSTRFFLTNIQSIIKKLDMVLHHMEVNKIDIGFITETWINDKIDRDIITSQAKNTGYSIISKERLNRKGGGLMCIYKKGLKVEKIRSISKKSFEGLVIRFQQTVFFLIYRPPYSKKNPHNFSTFFEEISEALTSLLQENSQPTIIGDFNIPWNLSGHTDTRRMSELLQTFNLVQEIEFPTHRAGNILDWIIHKEEENCIQNLTNSEYLSDHCIIEWTMRKPPIISEKIEKHSRNLKNIDIELFKDDLKNKIQDLQNNVNTEEMYENYIKIITSTIEEHAPSIRKKYTKRKKNSWFNQEALKLKVHRRKAEKIWQRRKCELYKRLYLQADKHYKKHLFQTKKEILRDKLNSGKNKSKTLYKITKSLTSDISENTLPIATSTKELANAFANFFVEKVNKIRAKFKHDENYHIPTRSCKTLSNFQIITDEELIKTIKTMNRTTSSGDPCNTEFLLKFTQVLAPIWTT